MCERTQILGVDRDGAFAEYVAVPESVVWQNDRAKLPPEIATLQEPFGNAVFAVESRRPRRARPSPFSAAGRSGCSASRIARASAPAACSRRTLRPFRLDLARAMGADATIDVRDAGRRRRGVRRRERGRSISTSSSRCRAPPDAIRDAFRIVRNGGRVVLFGIPAHPVEIDVAEALIFKNLEVSAVNGREVFATWYRTRWLLEHGVVDLRPLITARAAARRTSSDAFELLDAGEACKIVLRPDGVRTSRPPRPAAGGSDERAARDAAAAELDALRDGAARTSGSTRSSRRRARSCEMAGRGEVVVLSSNNYLGLATQPEVVRAGIDGLTATAPAPRRCASSAGRSRRISSSSAALADVLRHRGRAHLRLLLERERGGRSRRSPTPRR